ncbi:MAG: tyrosine-type recombinase/integrase [Candidatus Omnitrophota bacterium]|nr:tyrosine-type recombinase/integrase [Candidatus Omnitrophota bacterium]
MLKEYPKFKRGEIELFYNSLSKNEKELLSDYLEYRKARGITTEEKVKDIRRYWLHVRYILQKEFAGMNLKDLRGLLVIINNSHLSDDSKNSLKTDLKNLLKYSFQDWSSRFANLEDIKLISKPRRKRGLDHKNIFKKQDIEMLMKHETEMFWKAFLITQYEAGLRTKEVRFLRWEDIVFNADGDLSELNIYSTKTKEARVVYVKEATFYLQKLKEQQENTNQKGVYIFHSKHDLNQPIPKYNVAMWFRDLTKKALGRVGWCYILRHSRATELYTLSDEGKISEKTANRFMGHSKDMGDVYRKISPDKIKEMLKSQIYKLEDLPEEKKHELEKEINEIKKESVAQQDEITKLKSEVNKQRGMWDKFSEVNMVLEAIDKSEIMKAELKKYRESLPSNN